MKSLIIASLLFACLSMSAFSQSTSPQVVASAGNYAESGGISLSWTLGEPVIATATNGSVTMTQGFQQPNYNVVVVKHLENPSLDVNVFPNPSNGLLNIQWTGNIDTKAQIYLFDITGKQILVNATSTQAGIGNLDITKLANAQYILKIVTEDNKFSKDFRITKE